MNLKISIFSILITIVFQLNAQEKNPAQADHKKAIPIDDPVKSIFKLTKDQYTNKSGFLRYSVLSGYREEVEPIKGLINFAAHTDSISQTRHIFCFNSSIQDLLTKGLIPNSKVILDVKDPEKYRYDVIYGDKDRWMKANARCYELVMPLAAMTDGAIIMKDLTSVLNVKAGYEKRVVKTLVLFRTSDIDKIKSSGIGERVNGSDGKFRNTSLNYLGEYLNDANMPPFINESNYPGLIDIDLDIKSWKNLDEVRSQLQRYDLDLKEEMREVNMFVIKEISE